MRTRMNKHQNIKMTGATGYLSASVWHRGILPVNTSQGQCAARNAWGTHATLFQQVAIFAVDNTLHNPVLVDHECTLDR